MKATEEIGGEARHPAAGIARASGRRDRAQMEVLRLVRFGIVGVSALVAYYAGTNAMTALMGLPLMPASIIAYVCSGLVSYFGHSTFSFRVETDHKVYGSRFLAAAIVGLVVDIVVVRLGSAAGMPGALITAIIAVAIPILNYTLNRFWVFGAGLDGSNSSKRRP